MGERVAADLLEHHGIKGQKWGVRRKNKATSTVATPSSHDAAKAHDYASRAKTGGTKSLSNAELQHLVNRMNLEQNYSRIATNKSRTQKGKSFVTSTLSNIGKQQVNILAGAILAKKLAPLVVKLAG